MKHFVLWAFLLCTSCAAAQQIRIIPPQSPHDASHSYFAKLLQESLNLTATEYGQSYVVFSTKMEQGRALKELRSGRNLDVYWAGTSTDRESHLLPIKVPLLKGLLGFRIALIREERFDDFSALETLEQLRSFTACQGDHWLDSDILESAGIVVRRSPIYENLFNKLYAERCDFFPRGVHEAFGEVQARKHKYPSLIVYPDLIVYYPFPMYFFVSPENGVLAERIELGLERAIDSGFLEQLLKEHPVTSHLFPIDKWLHTKTVVLNNPLLPENVNVEEKRYWIRPQGVLLP